VPLFWIVYDNPQERTVVLQPASTLLYARILAESGKDLTYVESHEIDTETEKKIPRKMIGRPLTMDEANALLKKM
jgi:hypothetical protein